MLQKLFSGGLASVIGDRQQIQPRGPTIMFSALPARCVILGCSSSAMVCVGVINGKQRSMRKSKSSVGPLLRATRGTLVFAYISRHQPLLLLHTTSRHKPISTFQYTPYTILSISKFFKAYTSGTTKAKMPTMYNVRTACYSPLRYLC